MKVGDLVKCLIDGYSPPVKGYGCKVGLIVERGTTWSLVVWYVLLEGKTYPFSADHLEVINESR